MNNRLLYIFLVIVSLAFAGCSAERNNPLSKTYHNTTARYNGYFLAKEKMRAIEEGLQAQMKYDYNQVLPIYPAIDSLTAKAAAKELEDVVKKASFPIQYHKNSKWIDDSYILIGKARFYELDFTDASRTFRYVNSISKDPDAQHEALIWLMRTFMVQEEMDNAQQVSEHLRKERLNKENARELYLARAQYHRILGDTAAVIENLALSLPNFDDRDAKSKIRFILAQLYQQTGQNQAAYEQYSQILRHNPPYELGFFSRLNLGQVSELSDANDTERIAGYYQKLLKDEKNAEYLDKILYEMAQFELRQQHYDKALEYVQQSLRTPGSLPNQKAYSHLLAGEIYFDNLSKYNLAQAHYDSALQVFPQNAPEYEAVEERRNVLTNFATNYNIIQTQDSLQRLARMGEPERMAYLQQLAAKEEEQRQQELAKQQERSSSGSQLRTSAQNLSSTAFAGNNSNNGVWYFDNPSAMATARSEFIRRWGDRPLQDFWRTRARREGNEQTQIAQVSVNDAPAAETVSTEELIKTKVQAYLENIPLTTAALQKSEKEVEQALFQLANIYNQNLKEPVKAAETFETLLKRFPNTEHRAEAYYSLFLLYGKANNDRKLVYYNNIKQQYPNSTFAMLIDDADYMSKNAADNIKAHALYDKAYDHYQKAEYIQAKKIVNQLVSQYPLNDIQDKVAFLEVMLIARTEKPQLLRAQLERFKKDFPKSPLITQANKLLASYTELENKAQLRNSVPAATPPVAKTSFSAPSLPEEKTSTDVASVPKADPPQQGDLGNLPEQKETNAEDPRKKTATDKTEPKASVTDLPETDSLNAPAVKADPLAYETAEDSAYYYVMIYPTNEVAFKDIEAKYERYNQTFYKNQELSISSEPFSDTQTMLVIRSFTDPKIARSFNVKQKAPQAPVGRIRGVDFTTFVISSANYNKFMQKKDLEDYLAFFKNNL